MCLDVDTGRRRIVDHRLKFAPSAGPAGDGLCNIFVPHATAGVAVIETGAGSDDDPVDTLERLLLPRDDRYRIARTVRPATAPTTSCRAWSRRRSRSRSARGTRPSWAPGRAWCWSI